MELTLYFTPLSPFARKVRVFAHEAGLAARLALRECDVWATDDAIEGFNPLGKVPTLLTPAGVFTGSYHCCEYLDSLHGGPPLLPPSGPQRWPVLQRHALADGIMEAAVAHVTERLRRPPEFVYAGFLARQETKTRRTLAWLERIHAPPPGPPDIATLCTACALEYLDIRLPDLAWRRDAPRLAAWLAEFATRASMTTTRPRL